MKVTGFSRVSKDLIVSQIQKELQNQQVLFITQHAAVPANALDKLRAKLRATNSRYLSVKNTLGRRALKGANLSQLEDAVSGSCGFVFSGGDAVASSKALVEFAKENEAFKIQKGIMNGAVVGPDQVKALAMLPSREVLLAKVLGGMQTPISKFVGVLAGTVRKVVTVLDAIAKKKGSN